MTLPSGAKALVVLSCHGSGASLFTGVLSLAGAAAPRRAPPPSPDHPEGSWEPERITEFNELLLRQLDSSWDDAFGPRNSRKQPPTFLARTVDQARQLVREAFGGKPFIVFQEPRATILWPLWRDALQAEGFSLRYVIPVREPMEVAQSLKTRHATPRNQALLLWANSMVQAERHTRGEARVFVRFEALSRDPERELDRMEERLGVRLPGRTWAAAAEIEAFVEPERRRSLAGADIDLGLRFDPVRKLHAFFDALAQDEPANEDVPAAAAEWLDGLDETMTPLIRAAALRSRRELEAAHAEAARQAQVAKESEQARTAWERQAAEAERRWRAAEVAFQDAEAVHAAALADFAQAEQDRAAAAARAVEAAASLELAETRAAEADARERAAQERAVHADARAQQAEARAAEADARAQHAETRAAQAEAELHAAAAEAAARFHELAIRLTGAEAVAAEAVAARDAAAQASDLARREAAEAREGREALGAELAALSAELEERERRLAEADADRRSLHEVTARLVAAESEAAESAAARDVVVQSLVQARREATEAIQAREALGKELGARDRRLAELGAETRTLSDTLEDARQRLEQSAARNREALARAEQNERAARAAQDRAKVTESSLALLQQRITEAELAARTQAGTAERARLERDEAQAALKAADAELRRQIELERRHISETSRLREALAETAISTHAAQGRAQDLQAQLDQTQRELAQERGRSWWSRLRGRP